MSNVARIAWAGLGLTVSLLLLPACGSSALGTSRDAAPADVARNPGPADSSPAIPDDVASPLPDLAPASPDVPADQPIVRDLLDILDRPPLSDSNPSPDASPAKSDALPTIDADASAELARECTASGGTVNTQLCCSTGVSEFRDTCTTAIGACSCQPTYSVALRVCTCPNGGCFLPGYGCVGPASTCTVGMDQTCNDSSLISSIHGQCIAGGRCLCTSFALSTSSGKCL